MKSNLRISLLLLAVMASGKAWALQVVVGPYLQNPAETSMTVMWITDSPCTSWVEYGTGETLDQKAFHSRHGLLDAGTTIHRIPIRGLSPHQEYRYRICSREILKFDPYQVTYGETLTGDTCSFRTLSRQKESFSFVVLNDLHQRNDLLAGLLQIAAAQPYDLLFLNGDILGHIEDQAQVIRHVLQPCSGLFASRIPFVYIRGNHETRGKFARMLPDYLDLPESRYYYSFNHGPVHFIILDGGEDKEDSHREYSGLADFDAYRKEQTRWLEKEMQTEPFQQSAFRIVLVHIPPMPSEQWHGTNDLYNQWRPLFNQGKIDLMISGHTHEYAVMPPDLPLREYPMIIGGSPQEGRATIIRVDVAGGRLDVTMTRDDGVTAGTYQVPGR